MDGTALTGLLSHTVLPYFGVPYAILSFLAKILGFVPRRFHDRTCDGILRWLDTVRALAFVRTLTLCPRAEK